MTDVLEGLNEIDSKAATINLDVPKEYRISNEEINKAWGNANFGDCDKRDVIIETLLQIAGDFSTGHTAMTICQDLKLLGKHSRGNLPNLTKKGRRVMYYWNSRITDYSRQTIKEAIKEIERLTEQNKCLLENTDSQRQTNDTLIKKLRSCKD